MAKTLLVPNFLYDGTLSPPRQGMAVLLDGATVEAVEPVTELRVHGLKPTILAGTLMPGLMDVHTHVVLSSSADPAYTYRTESTARTTARALKHLAQHLLAGVTTIRDLGGGRDGLDLDLMRAQADGAVMGPRMVAAGALVAMTGGHACYLGVEADGPDAVRRAVRAQLAAGALVIKVVATGGIISNGVEPGSPQLSEAELKAAVEEAVHAGRRVSAHAQGSQGILNALLAGVHSIEHGFQLDGPCLELMQVQGTTLVPTFSAMRAMTTNLDKLPAFIARKVTAVGQSHPQSFSKALAAGISLAAGTDAGTPFNPHGNVAQEVALLVEHGASPLAALHAATGGAARLLGREDLGVVRPGAVADLLHVEGNPGTNVKALTAVRQVWQAGAVVERNLLWGLVHGLAPVGSPS